MNDDSDILEYLKVSSPAPVTTLSPKGLTAIYNTLL